MDIMQCELDLVTMMQCELDLLTQAGTVKLLSQEKACS